MSLGLAPIESMQVASALARMGRIADSDEEAAAIGLKIGQLYVTRMGEIRYRVY